MDAHCLVKGGQDSFVFWPGLENISVHCLTNPNNDKVM